jgi:hypothetical protein
MRKPSRVLVSNVESSLQPYAARVGRSALEQLIWALRLAQQRPKEMTPADWENVRYEISAFCHLAGHRWVPPVGSAVATPSLEEAQEIREQLEKIVTAVIHRTPYVEFGWQRIKSGILWRADLECYHTWSVGAGWNFQVMSTLGDLLARYGHLVRACTALLPRSREGVCGIWFVAARAQQRFCSPRCQTRATTRAYRDTHPKSARRPGRPKKGTRGQIPTAR